MEHKDEICLDPDTFPGNLAYRKVDLLFFLAFEDVLLDDAFVLVEVDDPYPLAFPVVEIGLCPDIGAFVIDD